MTQPSDKTFPLNEENVLQFTTLELLRKWKSLGKVGFSIPDAKLNEIEISAASDEERFTMTISSWLHGTGQPPSWRMLIYALDKINEVKVADKLMIYAEPQKDTTLTVENAVNVFSQVNPVNVSRVWNHLGVQPFRWSPVSAQNSNEAKHTGGCSYYVKVHPNSLSWDPLHVYLYKLGETDAIEKIISLMPSQSGKRDLTLTVENVMCVLRHCQPDEIVKYLIPIVQLQKEYATLEKCYQECASYYIKYNPHASWIDLATTLYWHGADSTFLDRRVKPYLPRRASSLTLSNLKSGLIDIKGSDWNKLGHAMGIHAERMNNSSPSVDEQILHTYVNEYPGCSWKHICASLQQIGYTKLADDFNSKYCKSYIEPSLPVITGSPQPAHKIQGESVSFSVTVSGKLNFIPHWMKDGEAINGANSLSFDIASVSTQNAGIYKCVLSSEAGSVESTAAELTVIDTVFARTSASKEGYTVIAHNSACLVYVSENSTIQVTLRNIKSMELHPWSEDDKIRLTPIIEIFPANNIPVQLENQPLIVELMNTVEISQEFQNTTSFFLYSSESTLDNVTWKQVELEQSTMLKDRAVFKITSFGYFTVVAHFSPPSVSMTLLPNQKDLVDLQFSEVLGLKIQIPPCSINSEDPVQVKATTYYSDPISSIESTIASPCISLEPHGINLLQNVIITFPIPDWEEIVNEHPDTELQLWHNPGQADAVEDWKMVQNGNIEIGKDAMGRYVGTVIVPHFSSVMIRIRRSLKKRISKLFPRVYSVRRKRQVFMSKETVHINPSGTVIQFAIVAVILPFEGDQTSKTPQGYNFKLSDSEDAPVQFIGDTSCFTAQVQLSGKVFCSASVAQLKQIKNGKLPENSDTPCRVEFLFVLSHSITGGQGLNLLSDGVIGQLIISQQLNDVTMEVDDCCLIKCSQFHESDMSFTDSASPTVSPSRETGFDQQQRSPKSYNYKMIYEALWSIRAKWFNLGVALHIDPGTLAAIKRNSNNEVEQCLFEVIQTWLSTDAPDILTIWNTLADLLESKTIGEKRLANDLREKDHPPTHVRPWRWSENENHYIRQE